MKSKPDTNFPIPIAVRGAARAKVAIWRAISLMARILGLCLFSCAPISFAWSQNTTTQAIRVVFAQQVRDRPPPLSLLDIPPQDDGLAGARLAISDNNTTGRFLKQEFLLDAVQSADVSNLIGDVIRKVAEGVSFVVVDAEPQTVIALADALKGKDALVLDAGTADDGLRENNCRANVVHTSPSRTMLADALAQYLAWKQWRRWFLVLGPTSDDEAFAEALRRAAKRFGARIVEERVFQDVGASRRSDSGHEQVQLQIPGFTQNAPVHDVLVVADEGGLFGEYFPYRTWEARPVVGTQGLVPTSWHASLEQWGATQLQNRFRRLSGRAMRPLDYDVWMAVRAIGEAATRRSGATKDIIRYMQSSHFELAAFKGQKLTFRAWNGQLRQPILIATAKLVVTVSPQPGFLHQYSELDTLGIDKPESRCQDYAHSSTD
jgi:ABC transporter substrate binding protein (PQQ-dependent alcohol dehydrogenase system)